MRDDLLYHLFMSPNICRAHCTITHLYHITSITPYLLIRVFITNKPSAGHHYVCVSMIKKRKGTTELQVPEAAAAQWPEMGGDKEKRDHQSNA